jgi:hypothetical protein
MDKIFLNNNEAFIILSTCWSFFSVLKGLISHVAVQKSMFLSMLGKIILLFYFASGLAGRLLSIILYLAPVLGIFDTYYHGILAALRVTQRVMPDNVDLMQRVLDYHLNGTAILYEENWRKVQIDPFFKGSDPFFSTPIFFNIYLMTMLMCHIVASYNLQKRMHRHIINKRSLKHIFNAVYGLMCPPLFPDWELVYRQGNCTLKESWKKTKEFLTCHIIIHFVEHLVLCIPLMMLRNTIMDRDGIHQISLKNLTNVGCIIYLPVPL